MAPISFLNPSKQKLMVTSRSTDFGEEEHIQQFQGVNGMEIVILEDHITMNNTRMIEDLRKLILTSIQPFELSYRGYFLLGFLYVALAYVLIPIVAQHDSVIVDSTTTPPQFLCIGMIMQHQCPLGGAQRLCRQKQRLQASWRLQ